MKVRKYEMSARADAAESTGERILDAMRERFAATPYERIRLEDVAADAGVTVQTVLRRFGSKSALMTRMAQRALQSIAEARAAAAHASPVDTIRALVEHYEVYGSLILKAYSEAPLVDGLPEVAAAGRAYHVQWCRTAFADQLDADQDAAARTLRVAQLVALCDATTWRILRFDGGLGAAQTEKALRELILPLLTPRAGAQTAPPK